MISVTRNELRGSVKMLETLLFDNWKSLLRAAVMCLLAYPFLIFVLRLFGKRTLTNVNMFDFIITVTYGATLSSILTNDKVSFAEGAIILLMLTLLQMIIAKLTRNSKRFSDLIKASPSFLYNEGEFNENEMQKQRICLDDLRSKVRKEGMGSFENLEAIVLEGDGSLSIIKKEEGASKAALIGVKGK
ncbi:DUF421 domain-containing protein [Rossellomorea vietnamensis]|uniref:DUF421 domain-containing protein n=2 Tax=Rossellomorea vietnamensis TaxID=218284 RepID=A0A5D4K8B6_9BACI|nr:DUF421 domain-containing protein [Rossellomorea vietnamensis]